MPGSRIVQIPDVGWIEEDTLGIIGQIQEYAPNLKVQYLDPDQLPDPGDPPWRIIETCKDGIDRLVFGVWQMDQRVLDRIRNADMQRQNLLQAIDDHNAKIKLEMNRRFRETMLEAKDITEHVIKSPKGRYSIPSHDGEGVVLISDTEPDRRIK